MDTFDFVNRANADYIDRLYKQYQSDPRSIDDQWKAFFAGFELGLDRTPAKPGAETAGAPAAPPAADWSSAGIFDLVHSYRELGHFVSKLDPLGHDRPNHPLLELSNFGITSAMLDKPVNGGGYLGWTGGTLRDLIDRLRATYCRTMGVEFTGISDKSQRDWLCARMEPIQNRLTFSQPEARDLLGELVKAEEFEKYLHRVYVGQKRFSLEGAEALIPLLNTMIEEGSALGAEKVFIAMAHRGRLNSLAHVLNKPYEVLLSEFEETNLPADQDGDGDVKYHLGYASTRSLPSGKRVKISLLPNPSHLELVDPIQQGIVRCQQEIEGDKDRTRVVPITLHGDASFTGQGIISETLNLSELAGFRTGGTIHIIVNNQVGFTTSPKQGRFTPYPTDVAKMIQAPIFHVNGDDPEAVVWAGKLAIAFRQQFKCDVFIDMWCYRRLGHNETDEPEFTQPVMYREIKAHKSVRTLYQEKLLAEGKIDQAEIDRRMSIVTDRLNQARESAKEKKPRDKVPQFSGVWKGFGKAGTDWTARTGVTRDVLNTVAQKATAVPDGFTPHPKLQRTVLAARREMVASGKGIDFGCAEMLAFGTLLLEGFGIRFTGQDVERGTFNHRHAVLHDFNTGELYTPLQHLAEKQPKFFIRNTMLSELATLGFEWGFASANPRNLVCWEAQFGDFVNGAQSIIDQIIVSAESKWRYMNGMCLQLPHGYEGAGPEHSNAYMERFLSLCAENNIQVIIPSTPASYFHALRRQMHRKFRKPVIFFMPKAMLKVGLTTIDELIGDSQFRNVIDDPTGPAPAGVKRVLLCSGKIYHTLAKARDFEETPDGKSVARAQKITDVAIVRIEQPYPFPARELESVLGKYTGARVVWVQEEPRNRGAWTFVQPRLNKLLAPARTVDYVGRDEAASPATGSHHTHDVEQAGIIADALAQPVKPAVVVTPVPATAAVVTK